MKENPTAQHNNLLQLWLWIQLLVYYDDMQRMVGRDSTPIRHTRAVAKRGGRRSPFRYRKLKRHIARAKEIRFTDEDGNELASHKHSG